MVLRKFLNSKYETYLRYKVYDVLHTYGMFTASLEIIVYFMTDYN